MASLQRVSSSLSTFICGLFGFLIVGSSAAQTTYPEKPIRIVVGVPLGGLLDSIARELGQKFAESLGQPIVIQNVPGAAGNIAADRVTKATPDGYTLVLLSQAQLVINPSLYTLAYDPAKDFAPVSQVSMAQLTLVVPNAVPAKSVKELIELAKAQRGELTFASDGSGGPRMAAELFKSAAGLDIRRIPYQGVVAAIPDLLGGRVTMMFGTTVLVLPLVLEGKLRALAVTSLRRSPAVPDLPTVDESGLPGFEYTSWNGLLAPAGTQATTVRKLNIETGKALSLPALRAKLAARGLEEFASSPESFAADIRSGIPKWAKVIKESGIKADQAGSAL